jgi:hypothetical protein
LFEVAAALPKIQSKTREASQSHREDSRRREICSPGSICDEGSRKRQQAREAPKPTMRGRRLIQKAEEVTDPSKACLQMPQVSSFALQVQVDTACQLLICSFIVTAALMQLF